MTTFAYGWKSVTFYRHWGLDKEDALLICTGFLDPLGTQSEDSPLFLEALKDMLKKDPNLKKIIQERYDLFKEAMTTHYHQMLLEDVLAFKQRQSTTPTGNNIVNFQKYKSPS